MADDEEKSLWWVLDIMHNDLPKNYTLVHPDKLVEFSKDHPEVKTLVYLDDVTCSGSQAEINLSKVKGAYSDYTRTDFGVVERIRPDVNIVVGIVYSTLYAENKLRALSGYNLTFIEGQRIESVREAVTRILGEDAEKFLAEAAERYRDYLRYSGEDWDRYSLTYFDHKRIDSHSFFSPVSRGLVVRENGELLKDASGAFVSKEFVPDIDPVYHHKKPQEVCPWLKKSDMKYCI